MGQSLDPLATDSVPSILADLRWVLSVFVGSGSVAQRSRGACCTSQDDRTFWKRRTMTEPWVPVDKVATHLGVAKDSVYRWIETKGLPAHRVGRLWKFKLSEVDVWVQAGGAGPDDKVTSRTRRDK